MLSGWWFWQDRLPHPLSFWSLPQKNIISNKEIESRGEVNEEPCLDRESVARKVLPYDHTVSTLDLQNLDSCFSLLPILKGCFRGENSSAIPLIFHSGPTACFLIPQDSCWSALYTITYSWQGVFVKQSDEGEETWLFKCHLKISPLLPFTPRFFSEMFRNDPSEYTHRNLKGNPQNFFCFLCSQAGTAQKPVVCCGSTGRPKGRHEDAHPTVCLMPTPLLSQCLPTKWHIFKRVFRSRL